MEIIDIILEWAAAYEASRNNPQLLEVGRTALAVERMERLGMAESAMLRMRGQPGLPQELQDFLDADQDKGCLSCWLSSNLGANHTECNEKISNWFDCQERLLAWAHESQAVINSN